MHSQQTTIDGNPSGNNVINGRGGEQPVFCAFLESLIGRRGVLWQGAFTGNGVAMEIRYSLPHWSTKKHHRLVKIVEVHQDYLVLDEHLPDRDGPHTRYRIPFGNLVISENIGCSTD